MPGFVTTPKRNRASVAPAAARKPNDAKRPARLTREKGRIAHQPRDIRDVAIYVQAREVIDSRAAPSVAQAARRGKKSLALFHRTAESRHEPD